MGLISRVIGAGGAVRSAGQAVGGVAEVFVGNRAEREAGEFARTEAALEQYGAEFRLPSRNRFDRFMDGLNRLPRPLLVIGTLGLFVYAMVEPMGFSLRMEGLALVPAPLWWLLGAIVSFYFGARELHYQRGGSMTLSRLLDRSEVRVALPGETEAAPEPAEPAEAAPSKESAAEKAAPRPKPAPRKPQAARSGTPQIEVRAADPTFNAAIEEWRQTRA